MLTKIIFTIVFMELNKGKEGEFAIEFISRYSKVGFGSMNKNDFEVMIFDLLKKFGNLKGKSNYDISLELQITESKVKKLSYEAELKYNNHDAATFKNDFFKILEKSRYKRDTNKVLFSVEDKFLRTSISAKLKELGHFSDSSFNSEIISIDLESFIDLLDYVLSKNEKECIIKNNKSIFEEEPIIDFKELIRKAIYGAAGKIGEKIIDIPFKIAVNAGVAHLIFNYII